MKTIRAFVLFPLVLVAAACEGQCSVSTEALPPAPAARVGGGQSPSGLKTFVDPAFGISLELPGTWAYRVTPGKDYLFEGAKGTDAYEISLVLQFVKKSANPGSSADAELRKIAAQLESGARGTLKSNGTVAVGGVASPFFVATYNARESGGALVPFAHTQLVVDHGAYYYLISFSGPSKIYEALLPVFEHALESLTFTT